jgi:type I restriction enzyme R subunit
MGERAVSNFDFARAGWPEIGDEARRAEHYTFGDPRASLFNARRALELTVHWLYSADATLTRPYKSDLSSLLFEPTFKALVGPGIHTKMDLIRKQGNRAVHGTGPVRDADSLPVVLELFHVLVWLATRYVVDPAQRPAGGMQFEVTSIPTPRSGAAAQTRAQMKQLADANTAKDAALAAAAANNAVLASELAKLRAQVTAAKAVNATVPDTHDYNEAVTRAEYIDLLLREAGWPLVDKRDREFPVTGMPTPGGTGFVDYVLWGENGLPVGVVEAKRSAQTPEAGRQQAVLYANALEAQFGQRPVIFYTNGFDHFLWDDLRYPPRSVAGFYTRDQLALLVQRRSSLVPLASVPAKSSIVQRYYQTRALAKITESFEQANERKALLVMATGSGKTRTVIALVDILMRANWAKRVLFLADRTALVNQATNAFKQFLPDSAPVNLLTEKDTEGRVFVSTYGTMMGLIDQGGNESRRFGPGYFDLIIIDEAHRSVYQKYGEIFTYFDSLLVGLTATPKDEVDHNTYGLFNLEDGVPTDSYDLGAAIADGFLVPPVGRPINLGFMARGIRYADLTPDEQETWDLLDWDEGLIPDEIGAAALNKWLFNADTVDKVLEVLMDEGRRVSAGDTLGKTIVFAKNNEHAEFITERFDLNYPEFAGKFARTITYRTTFAQSLFDDFSQSDKYPQIAISVDMLDTGIDVPDVVNLVFFKPVYSKTKYWQMIGRGTRLCPDLYGPNSPKRDFVIFDVCGNIEYFNQVLPDSTASVAQPLRRRVFAARVSLLGAIDRLGPLNSGLATLRGSLAAELQTVVAGMNQGNFIVRRHLAAVERFAEVSAWTYPSTPDFETAVGGLAGLPSAVDALDNDEEARRFDLFALRAQLGVVAGDDPVAQAVFLAAQSRIRAIASALTDQHNVPAVHKHLELISAIVGEDWWEGVTVPLLELMRLRLRGLVRLIDRTKQAIVYVDFEDQLGELTPVDPKIVTPGVDRERFRDKLLAFLREQSSQVVLHKLRAGKQLTALDLQELERILTESGGFSPAEIAAGAREAHGLGLLIRSIVGMERSAAAEALSAFVADATLTGNQHAFVDLVIDQLTARGAVPLALLYEAPFTDYAPKGPDRLFTDAQVTQLVSVLDRVAATAAVALQAPA